MAEISKGSPRTFKKARSTTHKGDVLPLDGSKGFSPKESYWTRFLAKLKWIQVSSRGKPTKGFRPSIPMPRKNTVEANQIRTRTRKRRRVVRMEIGMVNTFDIARIRHSCIRH